MADEKQRMIPYIKENAYSNNAVNRGAEALARTIPTPAEENPMVSLFRSFGFREHPSRETEPRTVPLGYAMGQGLRQLGKEVWDGLSYMPSAENPKFRPAPTFVQALHGVPIDEIETETRPAVMPAQVKANAAAKAAQKNPGATKEQMEGAKENVGEVVGLLARAILGGGQSKGKSKGKITAQDFAAAFKGAPPDALFNYLRSAPGRPTTPTAAENAAQQVYMSSTMTKMQLEAKMRAGIELTEAENADWQAANDNLMRLAGVMDPLLPFNVGSQ